MRANRSGTGRSCKRKEGKSQHLIGESCQPLSSCRIDYADMKWNGGTDKNCNVPWTPITTENVAEQWAKRQELTNL